MLSSAIRVISLLDEATLKVDTVVHNPRLFFNLFNFFLQNVRNNFTYDPTLEERWEYVNFFNKVKERASTLLENQNALLELWLSDFNQKIAILRQAQDKMAVF